MKNQNQIKKFFAKIKVYIIHCGASMDQFKIGYSIVHMRKMQIIIQTPLFQILFQYREMKDLQMQLTFPINLEIKKTLHEQSIYERILFLI